MENITSGHDEKQTFVINKVPVVDDVTVVLPLGQVTATVQAELLMLFVLSAVAVELEVLSAEFVFVFVLRSADFLYAKEFCIIGTILAAPKTSIDVIATTIMIPLIVWFIFLSQ